MVLNTQYICGFEYFLTDDYSLNQPDARDHMLMIANCRKLDHLLSSRFHDNY
ncbi:peptidase [Enterobacter kobei]|uniref:Peptidase n=1 Tax=Enterobacter kobei TaxID=208224 RepID=A0A242VMY9_9ENTR|nr:peptidase [Enterobacter kobei]OTW33088.1 peptidase [Enterobacter kobei]OWG35327.1 peptidase [Enterobacter kobei]OWS93608.1 peptidase [Enterobacter kobei]OXV22418.1 peptidase [Enterobacter kobei]